MIEILRTLFRSTQFRDIWNCIRLFVLFIMYLNFIISLCFQIAIEYIFVATYIYVDIPPHLFLSDRFRSQPPISAEISHRTQMCAQVQMHSQFLYSRILMTLMTGEEQGQNAHCAIPDTGVSHRLLKLWATYYSCFFF